MPILKGVVYQQATEASAPKITSSPYFNPGWVRFFQNNDWLVGVGIMCLFSTIIFSWDGNIKRKNILTKR